MLFKFYDVSDMYKKECASESLARVEDNRIIVPWDFILHLKSTLFAEDSSDHDGAAPFPPPPILARF